MKSLPGHPEGVKQGAIHDLLRGKEQFRTSLKAIMGTVTCCAMYPQSLKWVCKLNIKKKITKNALSTNRRKRILKSQKLYEKLPERNIKRFDLHISEETTISIC